jgi:hypothetical protein
VGVAVAAAVAVSATVGMVVSVANGTAVAVAEGSRGSSEAVQVGTGATVAAVLQADRMKAEAIAIPTNLNNIFLKIIIHFLSLLKKIQLCFSSYHTANSRSTDFPCVHRIF